MASVSGRSVGVGSEVGELADVAADENIQTSGILAAFCVIVLVSFPPCRFIWVNQLSSLREFVADLYG